MSRVTGAMSTWPDYVWESFFERVCLTGKNKVGDNLFDAMPVIPTVMPCDRPPALRYEECWWPAGGNAISEHVVEYVDGQAVKRYYQRPLHRMAHTLDLMSSGLDPPAQHEQSSHLCFDWPNSTDKTGKRHCCNPAHMVLEDDVTNKARRNCPGWIWIHSREEGKGNYWYLCCYHDPPCIKFTQKDIIPPWFYHG